MKKVVLKLNSTDDPKLAGKILGSLSGVMVTNVQGNALVVHCGQSLDSRTLINKLHEYGCQASTVDESPDSFF